MKICLVTAFPPSQGGLNEYGLHIARELQRNPFLNLTILADELPSPQPELPEFSVQRCWSFDDPATPVRLLAAVRRSKPDVVWFNLLFSTFGRNPLVAFSGLMTPVLARVGGSFTHVTLHHLMDTVELRDAGVRFERMYRMAGAVATRMLLMANSVSVLMPGYRKILYEKYGGGNVHLRTHGVLTSRPELPEFARRGNPVHRILAFGKWGTYKRLELMIEAFCRVADRHSGVQLVIAGGDHPQATGYVDSVKKKCNGDPRIEFTGYVQEPELADLFQSSSVAVMPYSSSSGSSGVAHLACQYGVPIVCADLPDFRQMAQGEELAIEFYQAGDADDLADCLIRFLENPEKQHAMAAQNFAAALRMTMPNIVQKYLLHFEVQQRREALRYVARFRRLPRWIPSKSLLLRAVTRDSLGWSRRSAVAHTRWNGGSMVASLHRNDNRGGELRGPGDAIDGDGVGPRSSRNPPDLSWGRVATAGSTDENDCHKGRNRRLLDHGSRPHIAREDESGQSEDKQKSGVNRERSPVMLIHAGRDQRGYGESGLRGATSGSNGGGGEAAAQTGDRATGERDRIVEAAGLDGHGDAEASRPSSADGQGRRSSSQG
jgi:glycosyltransferase involved in cell wall biosynthesis